MSATGGLKARENRWVVLVLHVSFFLIASGMITRIRSENIPSNTTVKNIVFSGNNIIAGLVFGGIYLSSNNGISWTAVNSSINDLQFLVASGNEIYAGDGRRRGGVFRSIDKGASWTAMSNTGLPTMFIARALTVSDSLIIVGIEGEGAFRLALKDTVWKRAIKGLPSSATIQALTVYNGNIFAGIQKYGIFCSTNNCSTWTAVNRGLPDSVSVRFFAALGDRIFTFTESSGVYYSTIDPIVWWTEYKWPYANNIISIEESRGIFFAATDDGRVFISLDTAKVWRETINIGAITTSMAIGDSTIFFGTINKGVIKRNIREIVTPFVNIITDFKIEHYYITPVNYYDFNWARVKDAVNYDLYCNDVFFLRVNNDIFASKQSVGSIIVLIEEATGKHLNWGDTLLYHIVARTAENNIVGVSNYVRLRYDLLINAHHIPPQYKCSYIPFSGSLSQCFSQKEITRVSAYSLNGKRVFTCKNIVPGIPSQTRLSHGIYPIEAVGSFGVVHGILLKSEL